MIIEYFINKYTYIPISVPLPKVNVNPYPSIPLFVLIVTYAQE